MVPFADFYRAEYPAAVRLAWLLTRSSAACEDVVQDSFAAVHSRYARLDSPGPYLRTTVVNGCRRWHRSGEREARRLQLVRPEVSVAHGGSDLVDALHHLPYRQRAVLVLRFWGDLSEAEIAEALGCRPGTVKSLSSRALARLRSEIPR